MRIAVLVKQIPSPDHLALVDGALVRSGVPLEVNAYCRRANAKAVELAGPDGEVVALTMGPPSADEALREMLACGAHRGLHLCDPAFAGADTLATAAALAAAIRRHGPFDLVLAGLNSLDSDTGQVPAQVAALLGVPFVPAARALTLEGETAEVRQETDDGHRTLTVELPAVVSAAERLCDPSKAPVDARAAVSAGLIERVTAADLRLDRSQVGLDGSPTRVGEPVSRSVARDGLVAASADEAVALLVQRGALHPGDADLVDQVPDRVVPTLGGQDVWCLVRGDDDALLGECAVLAAETGGRVVAVASAPADRRRLVAAGADALVEVEGSAEMDDWVAPLAVLLAARRPWAMVLPADLDGRHLASALAAVCKVGLVGDATAVAVADRRLVAWKPAFAGRLEVPITSRSDIQLVTLRPGVSRVRTPRPARAVPSERLVAPARGRVRTASRSVQDPAAHELAAASVVVGVGRGVQPDDYPHLSPLLEVLGNPPLAATRKVTDAGWLPRSRQVGITGSAIAPRLYVAVGLSGRFNHAVSVAHSGTILAVVDDPEAPIVSAADVTLLGDWRVVLPDLVAALARADPASGTAGPVAAAEQGADG